VLLFFLFHGCSKPPDDEDDSLEKIKKSGVVKVITDNSATTYYIYRDDPMGFEYDLAKAFADYLGVRLEIVTPGWDDMFDTLYKDSGDLIAAGLTKTKNREAFVDFSEGYSTVQQQIVVHKRNHTIKNIEDLNGATIHIRSGTSYEERINELQQEGLEIDFVIHRNVPTEELIRRVADREIRITIADSNIALLNRRYYPDIRIAFPVSEPQEIAWAVRKGDRRLLQEINTFFERIKENAVFDRIYRRYYANLDIFDYADLKKFHNRLKTHLPKYETIIRKESKKAGFDWRMIAAVVYQESHFDPYAESHTGVRGLMQITQSTAKELGIKNRLDPEQSLKAGILYLHRLYNRFEKVKESHDRFMFALASYNIGYGHVQDARKISRKKGLDPNKWISLKTVLPLLMQREYYKKTQYGYARGTEAVRYINRILTYYDVIKREAIDSA